MRHLNVRVGEHIVKASYYDFSVVTCENKRFLLELKLNLSMRDQPSLNSNITLPPLCLFDTGPSNKIFVRTLFVIKSTPMEI